MQRLGKDKAKSLEHIIRKCDPPTPAMPLMVTGATVPGFGGQRRQQNTPTV